MAKLNRENKLMIYCMYTAISRKVVGKKRKVHATIPKGSLGNLNKYSFH